MTETNLLKKKLRKQVLGRWKSLPSEDRLKIHRNAFEKFIADPFFSDSEHILIYAGQPNREPDFFLKLLESYPSKKFYFPKIVEGDLSFFRVDNKSMLKTGSFGILEPEDSEPLKKEDADLILIPAVAAGRDLNRLGRGGGFYDRFLENNSKPKRLCVLPFFAVFNEIPVEPYDQKIHRVLEV